jgi:hypothetical protein
MPSHVHPRQFGDKSVFTSHSRPSALIAPRIKPRGKCKYFSICFSVCSCVAAENRLSHLKLLSTITYLSCTRNKRHNPAITFKTVKPTLWFVFKLSTCFLNTASQMSLQMYFTISKSLSLSFFSSKRGRSFVYLFKNHQKFIKRLNQRYSDD